VQSVIPCKLLISVIDTKEDDHVEGLLGK
jgi:hypothetical protein